MATFIRFILGLLGGAIATYLLGTLANSQFVMNAHGVPVAWGDRINMTMFDISNMVPYLVIIAVSFLIAFLIAALLKKIFPNLAAIAYPIAGAAAMGTALGLMYIVFQTIPISGARSTLGFLAQMIAGGLGGWVFGKIMTSNQSGISKAKIQS